MSISVTWEIHRLKLSAATSVLKFVLSTTVYTVPLIVAVSPTEALGQTQVPLAFIDIAAEGELTVIVPVTVPNIVPEELFDVKE